MTNQPDWYQAARFILEQDEQNLSRQVPPGVAVLVQWRNQTYIGSIQQVAPEYSGEIVLLSKTTQPIPEGLRKAIAELDKDRLHLSAETMLDLEGRLQVLRRSQDRLLPMTTDQMDYMERQQPVIIDHNTGEVTTESQPRRYFSSEDVGPRRN